MSYRSTAGSSREDIRGVADHYRDGVAEIDEPR